MPRAYRILVADDEPLINEALRQELGDAPYEVATASNGADVLLRAHARRPDLILMSLRMPVLDGIRTLGLLRADPVTRETPVVVLGSGEGDDAVARALGAGAVFYLRKPVALQEVRAIIGRLLAR